MIIQTLPPVTGSILLPELLSIRTTSGASSITVRKELKQSLTHSLERDSDSVRDIWPVSLSSPYFRPLVKVFGQHATNQRVPVWCQLLVDIVPLLASWEWLPEASPVNTMHVLYTDSNTYVPWEDMNKQCTLNNNPAPRWHRVQLWRWYRWNLALFLKQTLTHNSLVYISTSALAVAFPHGHLLSLNCCLNLFSYKQNNLLPGKTVIGFEWIILYE